MSASHGFVRDAIRKKHISVERAWTLGCGKPHPHSCHLKEGAHPLCDFVSSRVQCGEGLTVLSQAISSIHAIAMKTLAKIRHVVF